MRNQKISFLCNLHMILFKFSFSRISFWYLFRFLKKNNVGRNNVMEQIFWYSSDSNAESTEESDEDVPVSASKSLILPKPWLWRLIRHWSEVVPAGFAKGKTIQIYTRSAKRFPIIFYECINDFPKIRLGVLSDDAQKWIQGKVSGLGKSNGAIWFQTSQLILREHSQIT